MTTTLMGTAVAAHAVAAKPSRVYEADSELAVETGAAEPFVRFSRNMVPDDDQTQGGRLALTQVDDWSGSTTLTVQRAASKWRPRTLTWNTRPAVTGLPVSVTKTGSADKTTWVFDVADDVAAWQAGEPNWGWVVTSDSTTRRYLRGPTARRLAPALEVDHSTLPGAPTDLRPSAGAVSSTRPALSATAPGITALRVQVDPTQDARAGWVAPTFDSGWVPATVARFLLAASTYGGLTSGSTNWHMQVRNDSGDSPWSATATFSYATLPAPAISSPGVTASDPTPPTVWAAPGQVAWRLFREDATARVLADTGWRPGTDTEHTLPTGPRSGGQSVTDVLQVRDAVVRDGSGGPTFGEDRQTWTFLYSPTVAPVSWLSVSAVGVLPVARLTWDRAEIPDGWVILRDGVIIATLDGTEPADSGVYVWEDWSAATFTAYTYAVLPVVNAETAEVDEALTDTVTLDATGVWVLDPATGGYFSLAGTSYAPDEADPSVLYIPHAALPGAPRVIKHSSGRLLGMGGRIEGTLEDYAGRSWVDQEADLRSIRARRSEVFRLVRGTRNVPVVVLSLSAVDAEDALPSHWEQATGFRFAQVGEYDDEDG